MPVPTAQSSSRSQYKNRIGEMVSKCVESQRAHRAHVVLAQFPPDSAAGLEVVRVEGEALSESTRLRPSPELYGWPETAVHSFRYPLLACVVEGEADFRIGVTETMASQTATQEPACRAYVVRATAVTMVLIPPGVPYSDGIHMPHWERPGLHQARSNILWIYFVNQGAVLYYCSTNGAVHTYSSSIFVSNPWALSLAENLIDNARNSRSLSGEEEQALLFALLLAIERGCGVNTVRLWKGSLQQDEHQGIRDILPQGEVIKRSVNFIKANLAGNLTVEKIAGHAFVSTAQLNRLFRAAMDVSVIEYVTRERIALAKTLLERTDITISEVSRSSGYSRANYFSRMFFQATGQTPRGYRESMRADDHSDEA